MKYLVASSVILIAAVIGVIYCGKLQNKPDSIPVSDLNQLPVIGKLGLPLGDVTTIRATIVDGDSLRMKRHSSSYLLKVREVNGVKLESEPIMEFSLNHARGVELANDNFGLHLLKNNEEADGLTGDQIEQLKVDYVGNAVSLVVYESGGFSGMPDLPEDAMIWADRGYGFHTHLEVLKEVKPE